RASRAACTCGPACRWSATARSSAPGPRAVRRPAPPPSRRNAWANKAMPFAPPASLAPLLAKPVAIFGGGVSGEGVRALLAALGVDAKIYDARGVEFTPAAAKLHALAIFSPGFPPEHPWLARASAAGLACLGELDFASCFWRGQLVAITG